MGQFADGLLNLVSREAPTQAGIIAGQNPAAYNASDPLRLWVIQVVIIIGFTQILAMILGRIRQPRVIAEVIGGVLLGPSVMGHIPHFTNTIFPTQSIPIFTLTANIGLVFFLFLVGLELDTSSIRRNVRSALAISAVGLVIPLGLGAAIAVPLYSNFAQPNVDRGDFILFVSVAIGITAFPVLCRILTELRLLDTPVGVTALAAGVGNDVVGWILLALAVALVNSSSGLTALWVLLAAAGYVLLLLFPGRWALVWLARRTGSFEHGRPTTLMMAITLLLVLISAFFTDIIGIHPIFGGFVAGLIIPKEHGFAIAIVEKLEDLVSLIFLPLYFVLSGLNTNLDTLDTGKTWGYIVLICTVAFFSKFTGCFFTAKAFGFNWRESGAIGTLMSCKGLVELIVLNVGFSAGILDTRTFSMFVLHALILTFMTTPLTLLWYPAKHRTHVHDAPGDGNVQKSENAGSGEHAHFEVDYKTKFAVVLNKVEHLPAVMTLTQLLHRPASLFASSDTGSVEEKLSLSQQVGTPNLSALRLIELDERSSAVLRSQEAAHLAPADPLISVVRSSGRLHRIPVSGALAIVPENEFAQRAAGFVREQAAHMVVLPWTIPSSPTVVNGNGSVTMHHSPFEAMFGSNGNGPLSSHAHSVLYSNFVRKLFAEAPVDVALYVERTAPISDIKSTSTAVPPMMDGNHLFLPFFGGKDDRLALEFVVQLCVNPDVSASVVRVMEGRGVSAGSGNAGHELEPMDTIEQEKIVAQTSYLGDTVYAANSTHAQLASDTADNLLWARYAQSVSSQSTFPAHIAAALTRISFQEVSTSSSSGSLQTAFGALPAEKKENVIVVVGRARDVARKAHAVELKALLSSTAPSSSTTTAPPSPSGGTKDTGVSADGEALARTVGYAGAVFLAAPGAASKTGGVLVLQKVGQDGMSV